MTLADVRGQAPAIETLARAIAAGRLHHAYRFEGPAGVGKDLAAFGLAQALLCEGGDPMGCGKCDACVRVVTPASKDVPIPSHPDVLLVERGLYDNLAEGGKSTGEKQSISVGQIRSVVLERQAFPPVMGRARVFIVRRPEELSTGAANCLLKTLEEPRPDTHFILVTSRPDRLLPTIRSRTIPVRFNALPDDIVEAILLQHGVPATRIPEVVALAEGSASAALELADDARSEAREAFVAAMLDAAQRGAGAAAAVGDGAEKGALRDQLLALAAHLSRTARSAAATEPRRSAGLAAAFEETLAAIERVEVSNAAPALTLADLSLRIGRAFGGVGAA